MSSIIPSEGEYKIMSDWAERLVKSGMLPPSLNSPEKVLVVLEAGREYGLPPYVAMNTFFPVPAQGGGLTLGIRAAAALGLVMRKGLIEDYQVVETDTETKITVKRKGLATPISSSFSMRDAERANLHNKQNWRLYPRQMRFARALMDVLRRAFPDILAGLYSPDELGAEVVEEVRDTTILPPQAPRVENVEVASDAIDLEPELEPEQELEQDPEPEQELEQDPEPEQELEPEQKPEPAAEPNENRPLNEEELKWIAKAKMDMVPGMSYEVALAIARSFGTYLRAKKWHDEEYLPWQRAQQQLQQQQKSLEVNGNGEAK